MYLYFEKMIDIRDEYKISICMYIYELKCKLIISMKQQSLLRIVHYTLRRH